MDSTGVLQSDPTKGNLTRDLLFPAAVLPGSAAADDASFASRMN
jgi:hypothetical protein